MTGGQIFNNGGFTNVTYALGSGSLTPSSTGIYYIGWHGYSIANQDGIYVDDISIAATNIPPSCATSFSPANLATNVAATANLTWASGGGAPTGYKIFFGTDNPPTNIANGTNLGLVTTYDPPGNMAYSTLHYWKIVPYNTYGDASGCTVISFTTQANPNYGSSSSSNYNFANSTPGGAGSPVGQPTYNWITEQTNEVTTWTSGTGDDGYFTINLSPYLGGTGFPFFGATYSTVYVGSNGYLTFDAGSTSTCSSCAIPGTLSKVIAGFAQDLDMRTATYANAHVYYGGNANRFVVTYLHAHDYGSSTDWITFQIVLYPNGKIVVQYNDAESTSPFPVSLSDDGLIGLENGSGGEYVQYRNNGVGGPIFGSPMALAFAPTSVPLAAVLADFSAAPNGNAIRVTWETVSEIGNIGFNLWRGDSPGAPDTQLNGALIPSQAPGSSQGFVYTFDDANVVSGMTYYYWVETVDTQGGVSRFGPVSATFNAPTAVRLSAFDVAPMVPFALPAAGAALLALAGWAARRRR
jgi:hypothetical protein